jgi:hypothetical protein
VPNLRKECFNYMMKSINITKCYQIYQKCIKNEYEFNSEDLLDNCIRYFIINFSSVIEQNWYIFYLYRFYEIPKKYLIEIIKNDELEINEDLLFSKIVEW